MNLPRSPARAPRASASAIMASSALLFGVMAILAKAAAVLSGAAVTWIRELRKTDGSWEIFAAFCIGGALITAPSALHDWQTPTPLEWLLLVAVGITSVVAQLLMTWSLRDLRAAAA